ncbi:MAG TPA: SRPBCC family protein [Allosphingosinicella sp.]|nr:SRPBCC family protein [Allosphingosinicella sp.]
MTGRVDEASRVIAAPPRKVWAALTDPEALARWLPPSGMTAQLDRFDLRPGGGYRMTLVYEDAAGARGKSGADRDVVTVRFAAIAPERRLEQLVVFESDDPVFAGTMRMTWLLRPTSEGTEVAIRASDVPPGISAEDHASGLNSSLANLARYVE